MQIVLASILSFVGQTHSAEKGTHLHFNYSLLGEQGSNSGWLTVSWGPLGEKPCRSRALVHRRNGEQVGTELTLSTKTAPNKDSMMSATALGELSKCK